MKDPTIPNPETRKKFMFYDTEERQAALRIRCQYDGITQSQFFRMMMTGYLNNDSLIFEYLSKFKEEHQIQGRQKRAYIDKMQKEHESTKKKFALDKNEIESIYDLLEEEGVSI